MIPYLEGYFSEDRELDEYLSPVNNLKMVAEYLNIQIHEIMNLPYDYYKLMFKLAYIERLKQTEKGIKFLKDYARYQVTDYDAAGVQTMKKHLERR